MFDNSSSHRLVGKFFTNSTPPSFEETEQSLRQQWILSGDTTVQKQGDSDTFLFEFRQENDKAKVLENGPFNVNGVILVIKDPNSSDMIDFTVASFLVAVVGLPSYLFTKNFLQLNLKSLVGDNDPVLFGLPDLHKGLICYRVEVDLKKPLRPGFYTEANRFVQLKYRNLGDFCYNCGRIGHVKTSCDGVRIPKERALNATSRTHVYGPWLRPYPLEKCYKLALMKSPEKQNGALECEKTLSYAQFFVEIESNNVFVCDPIFEWETVSTHRFRFPCSYLDTETEPTDFTTTSKAYEVMVREISENTPFSLSNFEHKSSNWHDTIESIVERMKFIKENKFSCDDKWLTLKLKFNQICKLTAVDYETMLGCSRDIECQRLIESKISDLIKKRVEKNENLLSLSTWENQIRELISKMGFTHYMHDVSTRANKAMREAVQMEISSSSCPKPADRSTVSGLERFKVLGSDMDRLDPCVICVGEMFLAEEATVLPCSHVYHSSCIERWLQVGHKCPLCGFKLPSQK